VASQKIAEAAQREGVLMKQLAAQSKALALRTWRDGVDMRAMAVVTLITLPGTFTAVSHFSSLPPGADTDQSKTLFSTSFFDFQPVDDDTLVSPWIWLYIVVTAAFTALCLLGWYYSSRTMARAAEKDKVEGNGCKEENAHDLDPWNPRSHASKIHDANKSSHDRLPQAPVPVTLPKSEDQTLDSRMIGSASNHDGLAPARAYWLASDIWGTQSYGRSGRACAMCANMLSDVEC